jgi:hypothetical protein
VTRNLDRENQQVNDGPSHTGLAKTKPRSAKFFVSKILISNFFAIRILPGISR